MTKPAITKRSVKGSPLTYSELDTNFDNLRDATVSLKAGTTGVTVSSDLNGTITLVAGSGISLTGDNTAKTVTIVNTGAGGSYYNAGTSGASSWTPAYSNGTVQKITITTGTSTVNAPTGMTAGDELILLIVIQSITSNATLTLSGMKINDNSNSGYFLSENSSLFFPTGDGNLQLRIIYDGSQYWTTMTTHYV